MHVQCITESHSCNHCCRGKAISIHTVSWDCVSVALVIQHAMRMRHILICGLNGSTVFFHVISRPARLSRERIIEHKMYVLIFSTTSTWNASHYNKNSSRYCPKSAYVLVQNTLFLSHFTHIFEKSSITTGKHSSIGSRVVSCGQTDRHDEGNSIFPKTCKHA
jgi:hypothetical protein